MFVVKFYKHVLFYEKAALYYSFKSQSTPISLLSYLISLYFHFILFLVPSLAISNATAIQLVEEEKTMVADFGLKGFTIRVQD